MYVCVSGIDFVSVAMMFLQRGIFYFFILLLF